MIFYANNDPSDNDINPNIIQPSIEDILSETKYLHGIDIKNFNYYLFESDLEKLQDRELKIVMDSLIQDFLDNLNENYLDIDLESFKALIKEDKKTILKKFILFFMQILPFEILKPILKTLHTNGLGNDIIDNSFILNDLKSPNLNLLNNIFDYDNQNIHLLKDLILDEINKKINKTKNFITIVDEILESSKKNTLENSRDIFEEHVIKQNNYYGVYKSIIQNTDLEKIVRLFRTYIQNDYLNIVS